MVSDRNDDPYQTRNVQPGLAGPVAIAFGGMDTLSLRQLDEINQVPKGTSFRRFKAVLGVLEEGRDFFRLDASTHAALLARLRAERLIYPSSVHVILITESGYHRMLG